MMIPAALPIRQMHEPDLPEPEFSAAAAAAGERRGEPQTSSSGEQRLAEQRGKKRLYSEREGSPEVTGSFGSLPHLEDVLRYFPKAKECGLRLREKGWTYWQGSEAETEGTCCNLQGKKIIIQPSKVRNRVVMLVSFAHENGHAEWGSKSPHFKEMLRKAKENLGPEDAYVLESMLDEGHSMLRQHQLVDDATDEHAKSLVVAELKASTAGDREFKIYDRFKKAVEKATDEQELAAAEYKACEDFGKIFKKKIPSGAPDGVDYERKWKNWHRNHQGENARSNLLMQVSFGGSPGQVEDESGQLLPFAGRNIKIIRRLPRQATFRESKIIFISKYLLSRETERLNRPDLEGIINNALDYGSLKFETDSDASTQQQTFFFGIPNHQRAVFQYTRRGRSYETHLKFDRFGKVFELALVDTEIPRRQYQPLLPALAPAARSSSGQPVTESVGVLSAAVSTQGNKISIALIRILAQSGHTCKPTALANADYHFSCLFNIANIPLRKNSKRLYEWQLNQFVRNLGPVDRSVLQITKRNRSLQGEMLEHGDFEHVAHEMGYSTKAILPSSVRDFIQHIETELAQGHLLVAFFAVSKGDKGDEPRGHPSVKKPENEHACLIVGLDKTAGTIDIAHWGRRYENIRIRKFYQSMQVIPQTKQAEYYKDAKYSSRANINARPLFGSFVKYDLVEDAPILLEKDLEDPDLLQSSIQPVDDSGYRNRMYSIAPDMSNERWSQAPS
jgi:hypothetical protein